MLTSPAPLSQSKTDYRLNVRQISKLSHEQFWARFDNMLLSPEWANLSQCSKGHSF